MTLLAGFAEIDITPPLGTRKIGWMIELISERVADPLVARAAIFATDEQVIGFIQLDTLSIRWSTVQEIRRRITERYGVAGSGIMVSATHNHAGPAVATLGAVPRDDTYLAELIERCVQVFGQAWAQRRPAAIGSASVFEWQVAFNRRVVMRDGRACTHGTFATPDSLALEGPIDPEVGVLAVREAAGALLGCLVNFSCHPTHHGGDTLLSAGYPGVLAAELRRQGCPVTLFLNGASGNVHTADPARNGAGMSMEEAGTALARDVRQALETMDFSSTVTVSARTRTLRLPFRQATDEEIRGTVFGAQRFMDPAIYDAAMPKLRERLQTFGTQPAEVQALALNDCAFVSIPAEYFVEHGLRIKEQCHPRRVFVVSCANGMIGYVPTRQALLRGGYETTFCPSSRMAPEAGDLLADAAIALAQQCP